MRVTIAFPCWNRGKLLERTLRSIFAQKFVLRYDVDLFVLESGDDGLTRQVAKEYGCRYAQHPREEYPPFQSITEMWNRCWREAEGGIIILQTAEVLHESGNVIGDLVEHVLSSPRIVASALIKDLDENGNFRNWYNHPDQGTRPGWISGAGPIAFRRDSLMAVNGYEEMFYGYGHEDDYLFYLLRKKGYSIEYTPTAVCAHQDHPRVPYNEITGFANRALIRILTTEIEEGRRAPRANHIPLRIRKSPQDWEISEAIAAVLEMAPLEWFKAWADSNWLTGNRVPEHAFTVHRQAANAGLGKQGEAAEMAAEAAWAYIYSDRAYGQAMDAYLNGKHHWADRCKRSGEIMDTWSAMALEKAKVLCAKSA